MERWYRINGHSLPHRGVSEALNKGTVCGAWQASGLEAPPKQGLVPQMDRKPPKKVHLFGKKSGMIKPALFLFNSLHSKRGSDSGVKCLWAVLVSVRNGVALAALRDNGFLGLRCRDPFPTPPLSPAGSEARSFERADFCKDVSGKSLCKSDKLFLSPPRAVKKITVLQGMRRGSPRP